MLNAPIDRLHQVTYRKSGENIKINISVLLTRNESMDNFEWLDLKKYEMYYYILINYKE